MYSGDRIFSITQFWAGHDPSLGYDLLDGPKKRLNTDFQVSASLSKKVLIFFQKKNSYQFFNTCSIFPKFV